MVNDVSFAEGKDGAVGIVGQKVRASCHSTHNWYGVEFGEGEMYSSPCLNYFELFYPTHYD